MLKFSPPSSRLSLLVLSPERMTRRKKPQPRRVHDRTAMTRPSPLNSFARRLLAEWRRLNLPLANANVTVAVSGGADSVALLLALAELVKSSKLDLKLIVAHLNHKLR